MSYQLPHPVTPRIPCRPQRLTSLSPIHRAQKVWFSNPFPELLTQVASRVAALKTLEGALLSLMLSQRIAVRSFSNASALLAAPELAKLFGVPESWVREQARLGNLPSIKLGHYVRFRIEEVERYLTERANQAA
jgi:excisionase family DNA binding protein